MRGRRYQWRPIAPMPSALSLIPRAPQRSLRQENPAPQPT
ncbi:MAG: hypothetical protein RLZ32_685, partial [Gemmatimonadota bacterium]